MAWCGKTCCLISSGKLMALQNCAQQCDWGGFHSSYTVAVHQCRNKSIKRTLGTVSAYQGPICNDHSLHSTSWSSATEPDCGQRQNREAALARSDNPQDKILPQFIMWLLIKPWYYRALVSGHARQTFAQCSALQVALDRFPRDSRKAALRSVCQVPVS